MVLVQTAAVHSSPALLHQQGLGQVKAPRLDSQEATDQGKEEGPIEAAGPTAAVEDPNAGEGPSEGVEDPSEEAEDPTVLCGDVCPSEEGGDLLVLGNGLENAQESAHGDHGVCGRSHQTSFIVCYSYWSQLSREKAPNSNNY